MPGLFSRYFRPRPVRRAAAAATSGITSSTAAPTQSEQFSVNFLGLPVRLRPSAWISPQPSITMRSAARSQWHTGVPTYQKVAYQDLYPGIDLVTWGQRASLKYEFDVAPGADWSVVRIHYNGIEGLYVDAQGVLHVQTALGELTDAAPVIYQQIGGRQVPVSGKFRLIDADTYAFTITGPYDAGRELVIDPNLSWSTYVGGSGEDSGTGIAVDSGQCLGDRVDHFNRLFGANNSYHGDYDTFVAKISSSGTLLWATYLGGSGIDYSYGIAVDGEGNALVTGITGSSDFSANNSYQGTWDTFVAKVTSTGTLAWSTYLGGDGGNGIAVDSAGNALVTGYVYYRELFQSLPTPSRAAPTTPSWPRSIAAAVSYGPPTWAGAAMTKATASPWTAKGTPWLPGAQLQRTFRADNSYFGGSPNAFVAKVDSSGTLALLGHLPGRDRQRPGQRYRSGQRGQRLGYGDHQFNQLFRYQQWLLRRHLQRLRGQGR